MPSIKHHQWLPAILIRFMLPFTYLFKLSLKLGLITLSEAPKTPVPGKNVVKKAHEKAQGWINNFQPFHLWVPRGYLAGFDYKQERQHRKCLDWLLWDEENNLWATNFTILKRWQSCFYQPALIVHHVLGCGTKFLISFNDLVYSLQKVLLSHSLPACANGIHACFCAHTTNIGTWTETR